MRGIRADAAFAATLLSLTVSPSTTLSRLPEWDRMLSPTFSQHMGAVTLGKGIGVSSPRSSPCRLMTCREVAVRYRVHVETVRRWVRKGIVGVVRVGPYHRIRITEAEAKRHFESSTGVAT